MLLFTWIPVLWASRRRRQTWKSESDLLIYLTTRLQSSAQVMMLNFWTERVRSIVCSVCMHLTGANQLISALWELNLHHCELIIRKEFWEDLLQEWSTQLLRNLFWKYLQLQCPVGGLGWQSGPRGWWWGRSWWVRRSGCEAGSWSKPGRFPPHLRTHETLSIKLLLKQIIVVCKSLTQTL